MSWKRRANGPARSEVTDFVASCAAYVSGRYVEYLDRQNRPVPIWALLNGLAHGTFDQVRALAAGGVSPGTSVLRSGYRLQQQVVSLLATEVLYAAPCPDALRSLQQSLLIPLESRLSCRPSLIPFRSRSGLATVVLQAIRSHQRQGRP